MTIQESGEMYLETIYILNKTSKEVRAIDIGEYMNFSKPSVSRALNVLKNKGLIKKDKNGFITLSKDGETLAKKIYERHASSVAVFSSTPKLVNSLVKTACLS